MKDKEKQIEEIANMLEDFRTYRLFCGCNGLAKMIYDKLLPKDSVVLSREEYKRLKRIETEKDRLYEIKLDLENQLIEKGWTDYEGADEIEKRVSKETAREFLNMIYWKAVKHIKGKDKADCFVEISFEKLDEIATQFGVDIKE